MSNKIEIKITNPKLVSNCSVNKDVCVRKPGPMAEVAIKKAAPSIAEFFFILLLLLYVLLSQTRLPASRHHEYKLFQQ